MNLGIFKLKILFSMTLILSKNIKNMSTKKIVLNIPQGSWATILENIYYFVLKTMPKNTKVYENKSLLGRKKYLVEKDQIRIYLILTLCSKSQAPKEYLKQMLLKWIK